MAKARANANGEPLLATVARDTVSKCLDKAHDARKWWRRRLYSNGYGTEPREVGIRRFGEAFDDPEGDDTDSSESSDSSGSEHSSNDSSNDSTDSEESDDSSSFELLDASDYSETSEVTWKGDKEGTSVRDDNPQEGNPTKPPLNAENIPLVPRTAILSYEEWEDHLLSNVEELSLIHI